MNRRSIQPTTLGCLVVVLMGQLHAWWLVVAWKDFQFILFATILATEFLRLSYSPREQRRREVKDYSVIILAMLTALFLDEPLRDLGGLKGYLTGATLQHVLFFFWMPRWIEKQMGFCRSQLICGCLYCAFHAPNIPLTMITFVAGAIFVLCYLKWKIRAFPLLIVFHYIGGSMLKAVFHMNLQVGVVYLK